MAADEARRLKRGPVYPRIQLGKFLAPMEIAGSIENFRITDQGTLRSVRGPTPYLPFYETAGDIPGLWGSLRRHGDYARMHGIFHALLQNGQREVLLVHVEHELWVFEGWSRAWRALISPTDPEALISTRLINDPRARAPTQFVATPNGVIIIFQSDRDPRPYFYDGELILPLGYSQSPSSPSILGPTSPAGHTNDRQSNTEGYSVRRHTMNHSRIAGSTVSPFFHGKFGTGRIGTISTIPDVDHEDSTNDRNSALGCPYLLHGEWHGAMQWIDYFGNLSPLSQQSQSVRLYNRPIGWDRDEGTPWPGETLQHQFVWTSVESGPLGTIGRMLYRTKDTLNSGTSQMFEMPSTAFGRVAQRSVELITSAQFSTIPENCSHVFPDNVPDSALIAPALNVVPIPKFTIGRIAMGRLFAANTSADPGAVFYSMLGRWGTFEANSVVFPDPSGREITGLWRIPGGVLAFTSSSLYSIVPADDGIGFRSFPVSATVGCVAPDSIAELPNGMIVWLGYDGFYSYDGQAVQPLSNGLEDEVKTFVRSRLVQATATVDPTTKEYICWVTTEDSLYNNRGYVFDGNGWKIRTGAKYTALCTTSDHRQYILGCGLISGQFPGSSEENYWGVWTLDHESRHFYIEASERQPIFETSWIGAGESGRKTALTVKVWFRETSIAEQVKVRIYRDWRKDDEVHSMNIDLDSPDDTPPAWLVTTTDDGEEWQKRRPYWIRKDLYIPSCEVFKLRFEGLEHKESVNEELLDGQFLDPDATRYSPADIEIIGLIVDESPRPGGGRIPRSE
jgi:hypothetical protein